MSGVGAVPLKIAERLVGRAGRLGAAPAGINATCMLLGHDAYTSKMRNASKLQTCTALHSRPAERTRHQRGRARPKAVLGRPGRPIS